MSSDMLSHAAVVKVAAAVVVMAAAAVTVVMMVMAVAAVAVAVVVGSVVAMAMAAAAVMVAVPQWALWLRWMSYAFPVRLWALSMSTWVKASVRRWVDTSPLRRRNHFCPLASRRSLRMHSVQHLQESKLLCISVGHYHQR